MRRVAVLTVVFAAGLVVAGCGGASGPATGAARLVPASALAYVHISTDTGRGAVTRLAAIADGFDAYRRLRDRFVDRLSPAGATVDFGRDVRPWLGSEAALALVDTGRPTAGSLVVLDVTDRRRARSFLTGAAAPTTYRGVATYPVGRVSVAFVGHYALIGPQDTVQEAIDLFLGGGSSLASTPAFRDTYGRLPADRGADAYVSAAGVRRVLAPQGGLLGIAGTLLDRPGLVASALALAPADGGARVTVQNTIDQSQSGGGPFESFEPKLLDDIPAGTLVYVGLSGFDRVLGRLTESPPTQAQAATGPAGAALGALLSRAHGALPATERLGLLATLRGLFGGEVGLWVTAGTPAPALALIARTTTDDEASQRALDSLRAPLTTLFTPTGRGPAQAPGFSQAQAGAFSVSTLRLAPGLELDWGVHDHRVVMGTGTAPVLAALRSGPRLSGSDALRSVLSDRPGRVGSLLFVDFRALLALGEQTGLAGSADYARVRDDLHRVAALGESSTGQGARSTSQIFLSIP